MITEKIVADNNIPNYFVIPIYFITISQPLMVFDTI